MESRSVNSSELGTECWSAKRIFKKCEECKHVLKCKLPEATLGRAEYWERKAQEEHKKGIEALNRMKRYRLKALKELQKVPKKRRS